MDLVAVQVTEHLETQTSTTSPHCVMPGAREPQPLLLVPSPRSIPSVAEARSSQSGWAWAIVAIAVIPATIGVAWADHQNDAGRVVAANVWYLDQEVSGKSLGQVENIVEARAQEVLSREIGIDVGDRVVPYEATELGFTYDVDNVVKSIMSARHEGDLIRRVSDWVASPMEPEVVGDKTGYSPQIARSNLDGDPRLQLADPVEPQIELAGGRFELVEGQEGGMVDVTDLVSRLGTYDPLDAPFEIETTRRGLPTVIRDSEAQNVASSLNEVTAEGVDLVVGSTHVTLGKSLLRRHIDVDMTDGTIAVSFDAERLHSRLEGLITQPVTSIVKPSVIIEDGKPVVEEEGEPPLACCDRGSVIRAAEMIMAGAPGPIRIEPEPADDPRLVYWASGRQIVEKVGEFTTRHQCCQGRVTNIHRIADIVRGLYLLPDESVSLNEYVGRRTRAKGFVAAGAIRSGHLEAEVGGGVSQFATTIFNAAFFSGLDIPVYQAHSLYFSRYPFGREATISHPAPDLVLQNTTDYPVLIWTSYTDTSITVSMYSTKNVEVEQVDQRVGSWRRCRYVETDRQRTYDDGSVVVDTFEALYRPAEGVDCNGNVMPRS